jgi:GNAT superfamily N-acetyltransferase
MGLKCKISYDQGVAIVTDNNGNPSKLYSAALSITQNQELALNMWATAYSKEFGEKGEKADLEELVKFMDATASTDSVLSPSEKFQVKDFMVRNGFTSLDELYSELVSIFKPNGYFEMDIAKAHNSGLYMEDEIASLNADAIDDILVKIEGHIMTDNFKVSPATETEFYKNTDNKTIFGSYEKVTQEDIDKAILENIEDFNDDSDFYNKITQLPFTEFSDRFYNDEEFANTIINKFRGLKKVPNLYIDGETITDEDLSFYTTVKNTILSNIDTTSMEADIEYLDSIDQDIWENNDNLVIPVLNEVEMTFAEANIDVLGIRNNKNKRGEVMELLESALAMAKNPSNENLNAYIQAHNQLIPKVDKKIPYRLPSKYDSYNIVRVFSDKSQDELYNKFGLIKVADNLYHKVDQNESPTAIAQEIYQQLKDKNIEIEELKGIDFDNKPRALAAISEYLMLKPTESTITNKESYTGYQVVFNHDALPDTSEDVKQLADIRTDETYLKTKFISDFYNYTLYEKAIDSDIYKKVLSKFSFTDSGIVANDFIDSIADVEYKTELQDYIRLKRDTNMKHLLPKVEGVLTEDVLYTNMPSKKSEYEGDFIADGGFIITNPTADDFIKMNGQLYRKVLERENAHMFEMFLPNSILFGEDTNYYTTLTDTKTDIDKAREVFSRYGDINPRAVDLTQFRETVSRSRLDDMRSDISDFSTLKDPSYTFFEVNRSAIVAYKDGRRVGVIRPGKVEGDIYSELEMTVSENHRGKGVGTELFLKFFDKMGKEGKSLIPEKTTSRQAANIYARTVGEILEEQPDGTLKVKPQETEGTTWQQVADLEISQRELNNLRTSIRNRDKDSYTAEILDEVSKAMKGEDFNLPFELDFLADGITYNDVANLLMQDEIFETRTDIRNFISNRLLPPASPATTSRELKQKVLETNNSKNVEVKLSKALDNIQEIANSLGSPIVDVISSGGMGVAFSLNNGKVLKLTSDFKELKMAQQNKTSQAKGFAKVDSVNMVDNQAGVIVLERVNTLSNQEQEWFNKRVQLFYPQGALKIKRSYEEFMDEILMYENMSNQKAKDYVEKRSYLNEDGTIPDSWKDNWERNKLSQEEKDFWSSLSKENYENLSDLFSKYDLNTAEFRGDQVGFNSDNQLVAFDLTEEISETEASDWGKDNIKILDTIPPASPAFQQENMDRLRVVPKEAFDAVTKRLEMTGLSPNAVVTDKQLFVRALRDANTENKSQAVAKNVYGFTLDNTVFINKDKLNFNTAIHEFGHLWAAWARDVRKDLYDKGKELVKDSKYMDEVREKAKSPESVYHNMNDEQLVEEALVTAIGDRGEAFINENKKEGFLGWLQDLWNAIAKAVGLTQMSTDAIQNLTLDEFAQAVAIDLLKGDTFQSSTYTITALTDPMIAKREGKMVNVQTIRQILKQSGTKQIEKDIIEEVLELEGFKGKDKIPFDDFKTQVNVRVMPLTVIESKSYSNYGSDNVGVDADKYVTNIYNTDMDHGITGHFGADFRTEDLEQQDLEIKIIDSPNGANFAVVRKDVTLTQENLQDNVFNVFSDKDQAEQWIKDYNKSLPIRNRGLFGHTRVWTDIENKDVYVAELQSDTFQKAKLDDAIMQDYANNPERMNEKQKEFWNKIKEVEILNKIVKDSTDVRDEDRFSSERKKYLGIEVLSREISDLVAIERVSPNIKLKKAEKDLLDNYLRLAEGKDIELPYFDDSEQVSTGTDSFWRGDQFQAEKTGGTEGVYRLPFNSKIQKRSTTWRTLNLSSEDFIPDRYENKEYDASIDAYLLGVLGKLSKNDADVFSENLLPDSFVEIQSGLMEDGITVSRIREILSEYQYITEESSEWRNMEDRVFTLWNRVRSQVGAIERGSSSTTSILRKLIAKAESENTPNLESLKEDLKIYQQHELESEGLSDLIKRLESLPQDKVIKYGEITKNEYVLSRDLVKLDEFGVSEEQLVSLSMPKSVKSSNPQELFELFRDAISGVIDPETYKEHYIANRDLGKYRAGVLENMPLRDKQFVAHRKNYTDRLLREEIRRNAEKGMKTLSIPTPRTLALIEGYIEDEGRVPYEVYGRSADDKSDVQPGDEIDYLGDGYLVVQTDFSTDTIQVAQMNDVFERGKQSDIAEMLADGETESFMTDMNWFFDKEYRTVDSIYYADRPSMSNYEFSNNLLEAPIGEMEPIEGIGYTIKGTDEIAIFLPKSDNPTKKEAEDALKGILEDMVEEYNQENVIGKYRFIEGTLEEKNAAVKKLEALKMMDPDKKDKEIQSQIEALKNDIANSSNFIDHISEANYELDASKQVSYYDGLTLSDIAKPVGTTIYGATIYEIDFTGSNLEETVGEHFKDKYNKEESIYDYLQDQGYSVYQDVRDGEAYFVALDKRGMGTQTLKQPSGYESQDISDFDIEDMQGYEKTILKKYEDIVKKFQKERADTEIIKDNNGNEWLRTSLTEDDGAKPVVAFQEEKTGDFEIAGEAIRQVDNLRKLIPENIQQKSQILSGKREVTEIGKKMGVEDYKPNRTDLEVASIFLTGKRFRMLDEMDQNRVEQWADDWLNDAFIDEKKFDDLAKNYEDDLGTDLFATEEEKQRESDITMGLIDLSKVSRDEFIIDFFKGDLFEAAEEARRRGMIKIPQSIIDRAREKSAKENVENISTIFDSQLELLNLYTPKEGNDIRRDIDSCGG